MAFAVDQQLGTNSLTTNANNTITLTTTNAVATNGLIIIGVGAFGGSTNFTGVTISGGSLTWNTVKLQLSGSTDIAYMAYALAPSGLSASTVLTATSTPANNFDGPSIGAMSFTGAKTSSPVDLSNGASPATGTPWNGGNLATVTAGDLLCSLGWGDGVSTTDTPSGSQSQGWILSQATNGDTLVFNYQLNVSAGSYTPGGTWGASQATIRGVSAAFLAAAGGSSFIAAPPLVIDQARNRASFY